MSALSSQMSQVYADDTHSEITGSVDQESSQFGASPSPGKRTTMTALIPKFFQGRPTVDIGGRKSAAFEDADG